MKTFPGWRQAGRAMRWARQQEAVTYTRTTTDGHRYRDGTVAKHVDHKWTASIDTGVLVSHSSTLTTVDVLAGDEDGRELEMHYVDDVLGILRVLSAFGSIPAELVEADDA